MRNTRHMALALSVATIAALAMPGAMPVAVGRIAQPDPPKPTPLRLPWDPPKRNDADKIAAADAKRARKNAARLRCVGAGA